MRPDEIQTNASSTGTVNLEPYSDPELIETIELSDSIELIYKEYPMFTYTGICQPQPRVFKVVFSCKKGKWHKSKRKYGNIIPPSDESYEF